MKKEKGKFEFYELIIRLDDYTLQNLDQKLTDISSITEVYSKLNLLLKLYLRIQMNFIDDIYDFSNGQFLNKNLEDLLISNRYIMTLSGIKYEKSLVKDNLSEIEEYILSNESQIMISKCDKIRESVLFEMTKLAKRVTLREILSNILIVSESNKELIELSINVKIVKGKNELNISLNLLLLMSALFNNGKLDMAVRTDIFFSTYQNLDNITYQKIKNQYLNSYIYLLKEGYNTVFNKKTYNKYVESFVKNDDYSLSENVSNLFTNVKLYQNFHDNDSLNNIEKIVVKLIGHWDEGISEDMVVLMNMINDNHSLQEEIPLEIELKRLEDKVEIIFINRNFSSLDTFYTLNLHKPTFYGNYLLNYVYPNKITISKDKVLKILFCLDMNRCGYYDYTLTEISPSSLSYTKATNIEKFKSDQNISNYKKLMNKYFCKDETLTKRESLKINQINQINNQKLLNDNDDSSQLDEVEYCKCSGRIIAINNEIEDLSIHEVYPDHETNKESNNPYQKPEFKNLTNKIKDYKDRHINCLYVMGSLERDNLVTYAKTTDKNLKIITRVDNPDANPLSITSRSNFCSLLGGDSEFKKLVDESHKQNVKIVIDCLLKVSSSRYHRKYKDLITYKLDERGKIISFFGNEGYSVNYEDTISLNYRMIESWECLVYDLIEIVKKSGIDGIHMDNAHTWPKINAINKKEMFRFDVDGKNAYKNEEILNGKIVLNEEVGFWTTSKSDYYPNPFFVYFTKKIWQRFPKFMFIGECWLGEKFKYRHISMLRSGIIPRMFSLPRALSLVLGRRIHRNGYIELCPQENVSIIKNYITENYQFLPEGSRIIQSNCGQVWPYPAILFNRGNWAAVDLLFTLMDIPMTFMNEIFGEAYRVQISNIFLTQSNNIELLTNKSENSNKIVKRAPSVYKIRKSKIVNENDPNINTNWNDLEDTDTKEYVPKKQDLSNIPIDNVQLIDKKENLSKFPRISSRHLLTLNEENNVQQINNMVNLSNVKKEEVGSIKYKQEDIWRQIGPEFGFDLNKINFHYEHRRKLRENHTCLKTGELIFLNVYDSIGNDHSSVLAYARKNNEETIIIIINFSFNESFFKIDLEELLKNEKVENKTVCFIQNLQIEEKGQYQLLSEVLAENTMKKLNVS